MNDENLDKFVSERGRMVVEDLRGRGITDERVLDVMGQIRREDFVVGKYQSHAYDDGPLPIGMGQTISQPYIVALMSEQLRVEKGHEILEIGTGSGYQTAVLSRLGRWVYTIERHGELTNPAQNALEKAERRNVEFCIGDGSCGWPGERVFDRIIITAAVEGLPGPLVEQLKDGGIMVAPVGQMYSQELMVYKKAGEKMIGKTICSVRFVKLIGKYGFAE
ncbi:MAG: protein-L-isoaspartate(D-aspartate) O-methyltransferase [Planctomycetes bacterium]|nr:protein-L-isoaspartate(D-aspartate) O-methyltransferase [Planctomycetota bacterium]